MNEIWDDTDDDYEKRIAGKNWDKLQVQMGLIGYRNGVVEGKEIHLQNGFDEGYKKGSLVALNIGRIQGILSTMVEHFDHHPYLDQIKALLNDIMACKILGLVEEDEYEKLKHKFDELMVEVNTT